MRVVGDSAYTDSPLEVLCSALVVLALAPVVALALVGRRIRRDRGERTS